MEKKKYTYKGQIIQPLIIGYRAFLKIEEGHLVTSRVVKIIENSAEKLIIETENSIYDIRLEKQELKCVG